jgi:hypothetical protein
MDLVSLKYAIIFHCKTLQNLPKFEFLVWKQSFWQPCCAPAETEVDTVQVFVERSSTKERTCQPTPLPQNCKQLQRARPHKSKPAHCAREQSYNWRTILQFNLQFYNSNLQFYNSIYGNL